MIQSYIVRFIKTDNDKTKLTVIADDPETKRPLQNTTKNSLVKYHEEFEREMKGLKSLVTDDPELMRVKKSTAIASEVAYRWVKEPQADQESMRSNVLQYHTSSRRPTDSIVNYNPMSAEHQPSL